MGTFEAKIKPVLCNYGITASQNDQPGTEPRFLDRVLKLTKGEGCRFVNYTQLFVIFPDISEIPMEMELFCLKGVSL